MRRLIVLRDAGSSRKWLESTPKDRHDRGPRFLECLRGAVMQHGLATLPNRARLAGLRPRAPHTIKEASTSSAAATIICHTEIEAFSTRAAASPSVLLGRHRA